MQSYSVKGRVYTPEEIKQARIEIPTTSSIFRESNYVSGVDFANVNYTTMWGSLKEGYVSIVNAGDVYHIFLRGLERFEIQNPTDTHIRNKNVISL